jgi:hypothetical protein
MALSAECEIHDWTWDPADDMGCPICYATKAERERALAILERKLKEMVDVPKGVMSVNDLNDLIDEIAFSDKVEFDREEENKTNFEEYLEEQLKNPAVKEAFEGENK